MAFILFLFIFLIVFYTLMPHLNAQIVDTSISRSAIVINILEIYPKGTKRSLQPLPVTCNAPRSKSSPFFTNVHTSFCLSPEPSIKAIIALFLAVSQGTEHFAESNKYCISAEESTWTFFLGGLGTFIFTGSKLRPYSACTHLRNIRAFLTYVEIVALESER